MDDKFYSVLHRIAEALETQNELLEKKERRDIKLDALESKLKKIQLNESKLIKSNTLKKREA